MPSRTGRISNSSTRVSPENGRCLRYAIISLLLSEGLSRMDYANRFRADPLDELLELAELKRNGLATFSTGPIRLNEAGIARPDTFGPWLYSAKVRGLMESYQSC